MTHRGKAALLAICLFVSSGLAPPTAMAQEEDTEPVVPLDNQPPYDDQLLRLSEILGALHYLRQLCHSGEGTLWRDEMQALIDSENAEMPRRARFVDRFNRGYEGFEAVYRTCTPAATLAVDRYMDEGRRIAREIVARYGRQE